MIPVLSGTTKLAGVMGWPVGHSKSPRLHGFWLNQHGIDGAYVPLAVEPGHLEAALRALPVLGFRGVNLTLPHKEIALDIVDVCEPLAKRAGAANTILVHDDGTLEGRNTDVFGFTQNLCDGGFAAKEFTATVLGAGGAARAVMVALQDMGAKTIRVVNRDRGRAERLCAETASSNMFHVECWDHIGKTLEGADLLVNATSLGMTGQPPLEIDLAPLPDTAVVTDIVYAPLETDLLAKAGARGLKAIDGLGMLLHQARPGFAAWFGVTPEVTPALRAFVLGES